MVSAAGSRQYDSKPLRLTVNASNGRVGIVVLRLMRCQNGGLFGGQLLNPGVAPP
jgi:hypothetical protein